MVNKCIFTSVVLTTLEVLIISNFRDFAKI